MLKERNRLIAGILSLVCSVVLLLVCAKAGQAVDADTLCDDRLMGVSAVGRVAAPQLSADGAATTWTAIVSDPGSRLTLTDGVLEVGSLPSGFDYEEAVVTLTLTADSTSTDVDIRLVIYDPLYHRLISIPNASMEAVSGTLPVDWKGSAANSGDIYAQADSTYARTGIYSGRLVDNSTSAGIGLRSDYSSVVTKRGWDYVATIWARGTATASAANRNGASMYLEFYNSTGSRQSFTTVDGVAVSTDEWTQLTARGTATGVRATVMGYSYAATTGDMYFDDALLWEITTAGILAEIDQLLTAETDAETLYTRLGNGAVSISALDERNKQAYLTYLADLRTNKGSALTQQELADGVVAANAAVVAADQALVEQMAGEVPDTQSLSALGEIALPTVSDSTVALAWTGVSGDANGRIRMTEVGPVLDSQPAYGSSAESLVMTLTLSRGDASTTVNVTTTVQPYTQSMSKLIEASQSLDISTYLNGQNANYVTSDLSSLPSSVKLGFLDYVLVSWKAVNANTHSATGMMSNAGKVTRGPYETVDTAVILQATLTKSSDTYTREYHLIVPSLGADDARTLITNNAGFESAAPSDPTAAPDGWLKHTKWADGANEVESTYAGVDDQVSYTGSQSLRITVDETMAAMYAQDGRRTISVQNEHILTAREGHIYSLQAMVYTRSQNTNPSVTLRFLDNEGVVLSEVTRNYTAVSSGMWNTWKNLTATAIAPAGTVMVAAELDGGSQVGVSWFDDVRLREMPLVPNGSFDLDSVGWTTQGTVTDGKLVLDSGVTAESVSRMANRGVTYFLSLDTEGSGTAALRFLDSSGAALAEYSRSVATGTNALYAYAPENTESMQVVLTGGSLTADNVKITRAPAGTGVADGGFEDSAAGVGTPWNLTDAEVGATTGSTGAGLTVNEGGVARSAIIPVIDGKSYTFTAEVKGADGVMSIELYNSTSATTPDKVVSVNSAGSGWNTITYAFDQLPEVINGEAIEHAYARIALSGPAVFDNVAAYSTTASLSNPSVENINNALYGTFPYNWHTYGPAAGFVANQQGQATEGIKSLGVELFGLGEGGVRSSMVYAQPGLAYQASAQVMGTGANLSMEFWSEDFELLSSQTSAISSNSWQTGTQTATAPEGTAYVSLSVGGSGSGLAYVDQASIVPVVRTIGTNVQLFLDDWLIGDSTNVTRTFQPGEKLDQMITGGWYGNVVWNPDKGLYEMWHQASKPASYSLLYRTSADGVTWSEAQTCSSDITNRYSLPSPSVFLDLKESDTAKRYKLVCYNLGEGGYGLHTSPDGINWTRYGTILPGADVITVAYDQVNQEYVATYKMGMSGTIVKRTHSIAVSKDLINWSEGVRMYNVATPLDMVSGAYFRADGYGTSMYPLGDSYIGFNWRFLINENDGYSGKMDVPLLFSRDLTEDWQRMYDDSGELVIAIPRGQEGQWDDAQTYAHSYPVQIGNETWWYYQGWSGDHGVVGVPKTAGVSAVKWRRNGFASLDFAANGTMTTQQFVLAGQTLRLNAKGSLTVELLNQTGDVVATAAFAGDSVDQALEWDQSVAAHVGQPVSLRFTGSDAQLYSLQVEASITVIQTPNGTVEVTPTSGVAGTQVTVTAAPAEGYRCLYILVDGQPISGSTFTMPHHDVTVSACFQLQGVLFHDEMDYAPGGDIYTLAPDRYTTTSAAWGNTNYITGTGAGNSGVAVVADPTGADNTCLEVTVENNTTSAKRYILVTAPAVSGDYVLEFDYMPTKAASNSGSGFLDVYIANGRSNIVRLAFYKGVNLCVFYSGGNISQALKSPTDSSENYVFKDDTWYSVRITVAADGYVMELWEKGKEATTKSTASTADYGTTVAANTTTNVEFCFGPYNASQLTSMDDPFVNYIDNITITQLKTVQVTQPEQGGTVSVDAANAMVGQTVTVTAQPEDGYVLKEILVNGQAIDGTDFIMPNEAVTVTAVFQSTGRLFYDDMEDYTADTDIPVGEEEKWIGEFGKLLGGTYTRLIRQDAQGNRYLEMTAANTASSTGISRFWLDTNRTFTGSYIVRWNMVKASDPYYVLDSKLPSVLGPDGKMLNLRVRDYGEDTYVAFAGSGFASALQVTGDSSSTLFLRDSAGAKLVLDQDTQYTMELVVDSTASSVTGRVYDADGQLISARTLTGCTLAESAFRLDHFACTPKTTLNTTTTKVDNVGVYERYVITAAATENGSISLSRADGAKGDVVTVTATPAEGYVLREITVDGTAISGSNFTIEGNHTVSAVFGSMAGAVEAQSIAAGGSYLLAGDVTLSGTATLTGELTIDLGGYSITGLSGLSGTVNIKDTSAGQTGKVNGAIPAGAVISGGSFDSAPAATQLATDDAYIVEEIGGAYRVVPGLAHRESIIDFRSSLALQLQLAGDNDVPVDNSYTVTARIGEDAASAVITGITPVGTQTDIPVVSINGIPARRMRDTISVTVKKGDVVYYTGSVSIYQTAAGWYADEDSGIDKVMLADMLNYGDEAHKALDDPEYAYEALEGTAGVPETWTAVGDVPQAYANMVDFTLSLKNKVSLNVYINAADAAVDAVTFNGETYRYADGWYSVDQVAHRNGFITRVTFDNIDVVNAREVLSFTVRLSETESFDMTCGIPDYVSAALANTQHGQKAVIQAMQKYVGSVIRVLGSNA